MTKLLIVESPNKAETIQNILGSGYRVLASYGHIRDLPARDLGMDESTFELQYELGDRAKPVVSKLRSALAECDSVLLATDPDREGEAISWHLKEALRLREGTYRRVTFPLLLPGARLLRQGKPLPLGERTDFGNRFMAEIARVRAVVGDMAVIATALTLEKRLSQLRCLFRAELQCARCGLQQRRCGERRRRLLALRCRLR